MPPNTNDKSTHLGASKYKNRKTVLYMSLLYTRNTIDLEYHNELKGPSGGFGTKITLLRPTTSRKTIHTEPEAETDNLNRIS